MGKAIGRHIKLYEREQRVIKDRWKEHMEFHKKENELARKQLEELENLLEVLQKDAKDDFGRQMRDVDLRSLESSMSRIKGEYRSLSYRY
jgi:phage-related protein